MRGPPGFGRVDSSTSYFPLKSAGRDSLVNLENIARSRYADKLFGNSETTS
jgi:hypothetical protein